MSSYKVLARKWRPQHFRDMIGQEPVLRALINALDTDRLHHAYLFTGMRGVGKTTIARIFAKCLNCIPNGVSSSPCGECTACRDIEAGRFFDLIEVDAASRTKVEETRELLENVPYAPASGRYKVYLIDEVHMFSTHSFNALLKTLEEPPEHVKFLLATTDPQKVPLTVLSRCLQFNLRRMPGAALTDYLETILDAEAITHERPALELLADAAEGSVRDSLSLVEQAAAFGEGAIRESEVATMLGRVSTDRLLELLDALGDGDLTTLFERVDALAEHAPDFGQLLGELLSLLHRVAMAQSVPGSGRPEASGAQRVAALAERLAPDEVQLWYQIGLHARRDLPFSPDPREAFDMALLRMHAFAPDAATGLAAAPGADSRADPSADPSADRSADRSADSSADSRADSRADASAVASAIGGPVPAPKADVETSVSGAVSPGAAGRVSAAVGANGAKAGAGADAASSVKAGAGADVAARPGGRGAAASTDARAAALAAAGIGQTAGDETADGVAALTPAGWAGAIEAASLSGMPRQLAAHCVLLSCADGTLVLQLESGAEHLNSPRFAERLRTALVAWTGEELALDIRVVDQPLETPSRAAAEKTENALADARRSIDEDPIAQALIEQVDGTLDPASVRPLDPASDATLDEAIAPSPDSHPGEQT